jgi:hypothetical protein
MQALFRNSFIHFPVHKIRLTAKNECTVGKNRKFLSRNNMDTLHLAFICMRLLLLKSMGPVCIYIHMYAAHYSNMYIYLNIIKLTTVHLYSFFPSG